MCGRSSSSFLSSSFKNKNEVKSLSVSSSCCSAVAVFDFFSEYGTNRPTGTGLSLTGGGAEGEGPGTEGEGRELVVFLFFGGGSTDARPY